jgi:hypothetical protein
VCGGFDPEARVSPLKVLPKLGKVVAYAQHGEHLWPSSWSAACRCAKQGAASPSDLAGPAPPVVTVAMSGARCHGSTEGRGFLHLRPNVYRAYVFQETFAGPPVCTAPAVFQWRGLGEVQVFVAVARHRTAKLPTGSTSLCSQHASPSSSACYEHAPLCGMAVWTFEKVVGGCTILGGPGARVMGRSYRNGLQHFIGDSSALSCGKGYGRSTGRPFYGQSPDGGRSGKSNVNTLQGQKATGMLLLVANVQSCYPW